MKTDTFIPLCPPLTCRIFPLGIVKAVRVVRRPLEMVPWREVVLHKTRGKAAKVVRGGRGLTERRWLLVWRERPPEMWRSLLENAQ